MSKLRFLTFLSAILLLVWGMSCQSPSSVDKSSGNNSSITPSNNAGMGTLRLTITDAPIDNIKQLLVTMTEIRVHPVNEQEDNGFITVWVPKGEPGLIDILSLKTTAFILENKVKAGKYNQIRMSLKDPGTIVFTDDTTGQLSVPSNDIKIHLQFDVPQGGWASIQLDFNPEQSLHVVQKGKKSEYILRPVINPVNQVTGS